MPSKFDPIKGDTAADRVAAEFDLTSTEWVMAAAGDYQAACVQASRNDGSDPQVLVLLEWPGRRNHTDDHVTVRMAISPEDAVELGKVLIHSGTWAAEHERRQATPPGAGKRRHR